MMSFEDNFKDTEFCRSQILEAREIFGNKNTSLIQYDVMKRVLSFGCLYSSKEMSSLFQSTLQEAIRREIFYILNIWK